MSEEKYECVFGYGECPILRLLTEEQQKTRMLLKATPMEIPALEGMPDKVKAELNVFLQAMTAPMLSLTRVVGVVRDLGPFCAACPKAFAGKFAELCKPVAEGAGKRE